MPTPVQITPIAGASPSVEGPVISLTVSYGPLGQVLFGDQTDDAIHRLTDLNGDGDATDAGEQSIFFSAANASGLAGPTTDIFDIIQASNGFVYAGDGGTDTVYRLKDANGDGDANDAGEANVWFSEAGNAGGLTLPTPNGVAEGPDGAIYVVNAGVSARPTDAIYRTVDLNGDGDANDAGEATVWVNLQTLNSTSSAFDISFIGGVAYVTDTNGGAPDTVYRLEDVNGNGAIDAGEASVFISDSNSFGAPIDIANAAQGDSILTYTWIGNESDPPRIYRLTDLNGSKSIDSAEEAREVWNLNFLPEGFDASVGFSVTSDGDDVILTSNGGDANQRNVIRLTDLNADGDYLDEGETIVALSNAIDAGTANRPRAVSHYTDGTEIAHPLTYAEAGDPRIFAGDLRILDADSTVFSGAEIKIAGGLAAGDTLVFDIPEGSSIEGSYDPATGVLTLAGAGTAAEYQAILRSVAFEARVDNPSEALRHISLTVYDERGPAGASVELATTVGVKADSSALVSFGTDDADDLAGTIRAETLIGLAGDDLISGLGGADTLNGREGTDTASYADSSAGVTVNLATGTGWGGDAHGDKLLAIENLTGSSQSDSLTVDRGANVLSGGAGDDTLIGGAGADILNGGGGGDVFAFAGSEALGDVFDGGAGIDKVEVTGTAAARLTSFAAAASNGIEQWDGNGQGIIGTSAADSLDFSRLTQVTGWSAIDGSGGDDQITGSRFDDYDLRQERR
jgi:hypothetical protein